MSFDKYKHILTWKEADLSTLPSSETQEIEFKSGRISPDDLAKKVSVAASAFWNSGGGIFIVGINRQGEIDGIPANVGNQPIQDWIAQIIGRVEPPGPYLTHVIYGDGSNSSIKQGSVVLIVLFAESLAAPHMAYDNKYYLRSGAHSYPATHFIVEAIRTRRYWQSPSLRGLLRFHPQKVEVIELVVIALNSAPAIDVELLLDPLPSIFQEIAPQMFPLKIPIIAEDHPFRMDFAHWGVIEKWFGKQLVTLQLRYQDTSGRNFEHHQMIHPHQNLGPIQIGNNQFRETPKALQEIKKEIKFLRQAFERFDLGRDENDRDETDD